MSEEAYAFVDGASFERHAGKILEELGCGLADLNWDSLTRNAARILYFDALPVKADKEDEGTFEEKLETKRQLFSRLRRIPNFHVREGIAKARREKNGGGLTQKGVDVALAHDGRSPGSRASRMCRSKQLLIDDFEQTAGGPIQWLPAEVKK
jgi:hypothetical protein